MDSCAFRRAGDVEHGADQGAHEVYGESMKDRQEVEDDRP